MSSIIFCTSFLSIIVLFTHWMIFFFFGSLIGIDIRCFLRYVTHFLRCFILRHSFPSFVLVRLLILSLFMQLLQKNNADCVRSSRLPIVVGCEANMYNNPGHRYSILLFPDQKNLHQIAFNQKNISTIFHIFNLFFNVQKNGNL